MQSPNPITITTPFGKIAVEVKPWITGREAEYIDELRYESLAVKADLLGNADINDINLKKIINETAHRKIEAFVVSVDGKTDDILNCVLNLHEQDYDFILEWIDEQRKKKSSSTATASFSATK